MMVIDVLALGNNCFSLLEAAQANVAYPVNRVAPAPSVRVASKYERGALVAHRGGIRLGQVDDHAR